MWKWKQVEISVFLGMFRIYESKNVAHSAWVRHYLTPQKLQICDKYDRFALCSVELYRRVTGDG